MMASSKHDTCVQNALALGYVLYTEAGTLGFANLTGDGKLVKILKLAPGSPAEKAGLKPGDIIVNVNGQPMSNANDTQTVLFGKAGTNVDITVRSGETEKTMTLTLDSFPNVFGAPKK